MKPNWRNVHDELPENNKWVLVQSDCGKISLAWFFSHFDWQNPRKWQPRFEISCYMCSNEKQHNAELRPVAWAYFDEIERYTLIKKEDQNEALL